MGQVWFQQSKIWAMVQSWRKLQTTHLSTLNCTEVLCFCFLPIHLHTGFFLPRMRRASSRCRCSRRCRRRVATRRRRCWPCRRRGRSTARPPDGATPAPTSGFGTRAGTEHSRVCTNRKKERRGYRWVRFVRMCQIQFPLNSKSLANSSPISAMLICLLNSKIGQSEKNYFVLVLLDWLRGTGNRQFFVTQFAVLSSGKISWSHVFWWKHRQNTGGGFLHFLNSMFFGCKTDAYTFLHGAPCCGPMFCLSQLREVREGQPNTCFAVFEKTWFCPVKGKTRMFVSWLSREVVTDFVKNAAKAVEANKEKHFEAWEQEKQSRLTKHFMTVRWVGVAGQPTGEFREPVQKNKMGRKCRFPQRLISGFLPFRYKRRLRCLVVSTKWSWSPHNWNLDPLLLTCQRILWGCCNSSPRSRWW